MKLFRRLFKFVLYTLILLVAFSVLQVIAFRWLPVPGTPLMAIRSWEHRDDEQWKTTYNWTSMAGISPNMVLAVIASEDNRFESHHGFDWVEIDKAMNKEKRKQKRGASTLSQQVAKNVFLWPGRSYLRKGLEAYYTILIEFFWTKQRIMETYLNVAEMGKGIYGVEAAARYYYKKPASQLSTSESAMIAACLPNPLERNPRKPTKYLQKRQQDIIGLMRKIAKPTFIK
jgi:monofunctional biosynthetic peptidoglycan transglycosylase